MISLCTNNSLRWLQTRIVLNTEFQFIMINAFKCTFKLKTGKSIILTTEGSSANGCS
jgi:hypothetical protein